MKHHTYKNIVLKNALGNLYLILHNSHVDVHSSSSSGNISFWWGKGILLLSSDLLGILLTWYWWPFYCSVFALLSSPYTYDCGVKITSEKGLSGFIFIMNNSVWSQSWQWCQCISMTWSRGMCWMLQILISSYRLK